MEFQYSQKAKYSDALIEIYSKYFENSLNNNNKNNNVSITKTVNIYKIIYYYFIEYKQFYFQRILYTFLNYSKNYI